MANPETSNIVTIPATAPFLDTLVSAILSGNLPRQGGTPPTPGQLAAYTLLLPTRRACRACGEAFLRQSGQDAILLPTIRPIGDASEDESLIEDAIASTRPDLSLLDMNPAISPMQRHLVLTRLVLAWLKSPGRNEQLPQTSDENSTPAQASLMARELARLMDNAETEEVDLTGLKNLVPEDFAGNWQKTLKFLNVITEAFPQYLTDQQLMSQAARRNLLLTKEAARLHANPPEAPVILAGSTGSVPAAARLMHAISHLPQGAIVLPGLDQTLDDQSFTGIVTDHPEHPQFGFAKLFADLEIDRSTITTPPGAEPAAADAAKLEFISQSLRPASSTEQWQPYIAAVKKDDNKKQALQQALEGISLNVARDAQEEAELIALILRHTATEPERTAALITPDRLLARRVAIRLEAWGIKVDDSGGRPLAKTMPGAFFDQITHVAACGFEPAALLALLKHPLTRLGFERGESRLAARALEITALRQPWLGGGLPRLTKTLSDVKTKRDKDDQLHPAIRRLSDEEWTLAANLLMRLEAAFAPLIRLFESHKPASLEAFITAHIDVAEALANTTAHNEADEEGTTTPPENTPLWQGAAGEQLARILTEVKAHAGTAPPLKPGDYPEFYKSLLSGETVRPLTPVHPRLFIWGPFEARLQQPDIVILGGLNEGTWPGTADANPWLSRPMCQELGLPAPEQHIGYSAHDFAAHLAAKKVYLTRAAKKDGVESVQSRWLMRIEALLQGLGMANALEASGDGSITDVSAVNLTVNVAAWAAARDTVTPAPQIEPPAPTPPVAARPRRLSVTRIEDWIANPYSIYARSILKLSPLDPLGAPPDAAMKGQIIHKALQLFTQRHPATLPDNTAQELSAIASELMHAVGLHPQIGAFWLPRFENFAEWFAATEPERRANIREAFTERQGTLQLEAPFAPFTLTARADRIDATNEGAYHIYDYKTGTVPGPKKVIALYSPQLPLEAAIIEAGGFADLPAGPVTGLTYIAAKGGETAGVVTDIEGVDISALAEKALDDLKSLIAAFDRQETPYRALRRQDFKGRYTYDDYAHLARIDEWGSHEEEAGE